MLRAALSILIVAWMLPTVPLLAADGETTLEGSFVWNREDGDQTGDMKAVFTPDGEGEWSVAFHFVWEDEPHVYAGAAKGSLSEGALEGTAIADDPNHLIHFRFFGEVDAGTFVGTHGWVRGDEFTEAGTLTLRRATASS